MPSEERITTSIDLECVLWRTRGFTWDYDFVLEPSAPHSDGWYWMHRAVFAGVEPAETTRYCVGDLGEDTGEITPFVAAALLDPVRRDEHGRPIAHYIVWFHVGRTADEMQNATPSGWEQKFLDHLSAVFDADDVFGHRSERQQHEAIQHPRDALRRRMQGVEQSVEVSGPVLQRSDFNDVGAVKKNWRPSDTITQPRRPVIWIVTLVTALVLVLLFLLVRNCSDQRTSGATPTTAASTH